MIEARVLVIGLAGPAVLLVDLVHAEPRSILVCQLELGLEALAVATLALVGTPVMVMERLTHVGSQVLRRVELSGFVLTLNVAEARRVEEQARILLLLLKQAKGRVA